MRNGTQTQHNVDDERAGHEHYESAHADHHQLEHPVLVRLIAHRVRSGHIVQIEYSTVYCTLAGYVILYRIT